MRVIAFLKTVGLFAISLVILVPRHVFAVNGDPGTWINTGATNAWWTEATNWKDGVVPGGTGSTTNQAIAYFIYSVGAEGTENNPVLIDATRDSGDTIRIKYDVHI